MIAVVGLIEDEMHFSHLKTTLFFINLFYSIVVFYTQQKEVGCYLKQHVTTRSDLSGPNPPTYFLIAS